MNWGLCIAIGFAALGLPNGVKEQLAKRELERLAGTWIGVSRVSKEGTVEYRPGVSILLMIEPSQSTFEVDPTKNPKQFRMELGEGVLLGIYQLEGNELRLCHFDCDKESSHHRPAKFSVHQRSGAVIELYERAFR